MAMVSDPVYEAKQQLQGVGGPKTSNLQQRANELVGQLTEIQATIRSFTPDEPATNDGLPRGDRPQFGLSLSLDMALQQAMEVQKMLYMLRERVGSL
jgi:hypothetical protein